MTAPLRLSVLSRWLPLAAALVALGVSVVFWQALRQAETAQLSRIMEAEAQAARRALEAGLRERIAVLQRIARRWELRGRRSREEFEIEAASTRESFPAFRAIGWVGPDLVVRWVSPLAGNEAVLGLDVNREPVRAAIYARARKTRRAAASPPIPLVQGGTGMLVAVPVPAGGEDDGFVYGAIDLAAMTERILGNIAAGYALEVTAGGTRVYGRAMARPPEVELPLEVAGLAWTVGLHAPAGPGRTTVLPEIVLAVSAGLSLLLGIALRAGLLAMERAQRLSRAAGELREGARRYRGVFEHAAVGVALIDPMGRFLRVNETLCRMLGYGRDEMLAMETWDITHPEDRGPDKDQGRRLKAGDIGTYQIEKRYVRKDGAPVWVALTVALERDATGGPEHFIVVVQDIGERKAAEREVLELNRTLEARVAERTRQLRAANEELERFAYSVSHDLRAPLRAMEGFSAVLLEDYGDRLDAEGRGYLNRIAAAATRMDRLIRDLLDYSRLAREELHSDRVELDQALREARQQIAEPLAAARFTVEEPLPVVRANRAVLVQALANLLSNAVKFVAPGTVPEVRVRAEAADGRVRLLVEDNGIGIAPEHRERVFDVFLRLHAMSEYPGTGIGLAIVRKGVERMGGSVGVGERPGGGSVFWVELPAA
ncbi:MAG TPA: ATP-binding protein [Azospirillaceae bacterium]|nr:ATP-binding protein [Azospirillaceae bacterium]